MKKTLTLFLTLVTILGNAQDFSTFGLAANPGNLLQNPGADPMTRFHLQYFGVQNNLDMSETAGSLLATSDVLQNIHELSSDQFNMGNETQIDALQIGLKIGDNFLFAGNSTNIGMEFTLDNDLVSFMTSGPVVVQVLEGEGAILKNREVMGATNPAEAAEGTVRAEYAESVGENSVHGSDAPETAAVEISYFFAGLELVG